MTVGGGGELVNCIGGGDDGRWGSNDGDGGAGEEGLTGVVRWKKDDGADVFDGGADMAVMQVGGVRLERRGGVGKIADTEKRNQDIVNK